MRIVLSIALIICALFGCKGRTIQDKLGMNKHGPDEFMVSTNRPLVIPSDYTLPLPKKALPATDSGNEAGLGGFFAKFSARPASDDAISNQKFLKLLHHDLEKEEGKPDQPSNHNLPEIGYKSPYLKEKFSKKDTEDNADSKKKICDVRNGKARYCDDNLFMKKFSIPIDNN